MEDFLQPQNDELWMTIIYGPLIPMMKDDEGKVIPKTKAQYGEDDYRMLAMNPCMCTWTRRVNCISVCTTAKQI